MKYFFIRSSDIYFRYLILSWYVNAMEIKRKNYNGQKKHLQNSQDNCSFIATP